MKEFSILSRMKKIGVGDHMVLLYDNTYIQDNIEIIISYIISRVINNERVFYISGDVDVEELQLRVESSKILVKAIEKKQLVILDKEDAYSKNGEFHPRRMIELIKKLTLESINQGYDAFAITGELSWVLTYENGFDKIMEYEYLLNNEIFDSYPVSAICRYNIDNFSSKMIKNIIDVHPIVIWQGRIHQNPFYFDVVNTKKVDIDKYYVDKMLERIVDFTKTKNNFEEEIASSNQRYNELQLSLLKNMIITVSGLLEIHDKYTKNHSENVANISKLIAKNINMSEDDILEIYYAGLVHDIGKTLIPIEILNKEGRLTDDEFNQVKKHSYNGYDVLSKSLELKNISNIVLQHHERYDGKGYPLGLKGNNIHLGARILCIADSFDAMTSDRPYRKALSKQEAIDEIRKNENSQFDSEIAEIAINKIFKYL